MESAKIILSAHKKIKDGSYPIVLQIIKKRTRKLISLGHSTTLNQWDMDDNLPKKKHPNYKGLKLVIQKKQIEAGKVIIDLDEQWSN